MVLKELDFLNRNNKIIIVGAMIIGVLYPFFTDLDIPVNPKYILIGASIIGMVLFWEIYGEKKYPEKSADYSEAVQKQRQGYRQQYPPQPQSIQQNFPQYPIQNPHQYLYQYPPEPSPYPHPGYDKEQFQSEEYHPQPQQQIRNPPQQYRPKPRQPSPEIPQEYDEETDFLFHPLPAEELPQKLPRVSDVLEGKAKLPDSIPIPKDTNVNPKGKSSFKKFGVGR